MIVTLRLALATNTEEVNAKGGCTPVDLRLVQTGRRA